MIARATAAAEMPDAQLPEPSFRSIWLAGAPRFARELFGPVAAFYLGLKLGNLVVAILLATAVGVALDLYSAGADEEARSPSSRSRSSPYKASWA